MMITPDALLKAYIDVNILIVLALLAWMICRLILSLTGRGTAFGTQLHLLNVGFVAVALSPFLVLGFHRFVDHGLIATDHGLSVTDFAVAQFLNGSIDMRATEFETLLSLRGTLIGDLMRPSSLFAFGVVGVISAGFIFCIMQVVRSALKLRTLILDCYTWRRFGRLHLLLSDKVRVPFSTRGLRRRYIVLPTGLLGQPEDLKIVLAHELQHIRQRDVEWEFLLEMLRPLFFWNPAFALWKRQIVQLRELSCDQNVIARKRITARDYCECLLRFCEAGLKSRSDRAATATVSFVQLNRLISGRGGVRLLRTRIASIFRPRPTATQLSFFLVLPLVGFVACSAVAIQPRNDWSHDRLMLSTIVNLERLKARQFQEP